MEHKCPWDITTTRAASIEGHLGILKWLIANGCPYGNDTWAYAAITNRTKILKWALDRKFEFNCAPILGALREENETLADWMFKNGFPVGSLTYYVITINDSIKGMKWLIKNKILDVKDACLRFARTPEMRQLIEKNM
jgi:hypothetical protein